MRHIVRMEILSSYRQRIDEIDAQLIALLRARYDVIDEVAVLKAREGIAATLPDRVDAVRENAARMAAEAGLDADFIRKLWAQLIENSCAREDDFISEQNKKAG